MLQLSTSIPAGEARDIAVDATWHAVGGKDADLHAIAVGVSATGDEREVQRGEDEAVMTSWTSVTSSQRELEAAQAYAHGDKATANALIDQNIDTLSNRLAVAPPRAAAALKSQIASYAAQRKTFEVAPSSDEGKRAAKSATVKETSNLVRTAY